MPKPPADTKLYILKAALLLFLEKGYKNVSYRDLEMKTRLSKGAIYHYFSSKEDLLTSVFALLSQSSAQPMEAEIERVVKDYKSFRKFCTNRRVGQLKAFSAFLGSEIVKFNWVLFCLEAVEANPKLKATIADLAAKEIQLLARCFISLQVNGALPKEKDPKLLGEILYYLLEGAGLVMFLTEQKKDTDFIKKFDKITAGLLKSI